MAPPIKPKTARTFGDVLQTAELANFNESGLSFENDPPGTKRLSPSKLAPDVMITYNFRSVEEDHPDYHAPGATLLRAFSDQPPEFELNVRKADRRSPRYDKAFDHEYYSKDGLTDIVCSSERMLVSPFTKLPDRCSLWHYDRDRHVLINALIMARYVPAWQEIVRRAKAKLDSWRVP